jgi:hypothetical protein
MGYVIQELRSGIAYWRMRQIRVEPAIPVVPMPRRALIADDDPLTREVIASMLEELGCETRWFAKELETANRLTCAPLSDDVRSYRNIRRGAFDDWR